MDKVAKPFTISKVKVKRPANLEDVAFWPVRHLAELIRTKQVSSVELTRMYLTRLHRYNATLNNVVTFLDDHGLAEAAKADAEIAKGNYKGPLHGIPWGAKDIISVKGFKTTWGAAVFKEQVFDYDASVVEMLRDAGAVLIAKVSTGELAGRRQLVRRADEEPVGSRRRARADRRPAPRRPRPRAASASPLAARPAARFSAPSARCGLAGLRPTFGRISRYGVMALSWTQDRLGPICRYAEDCALVMQAISKPDGRDMSVMDLPFNWNAEFDVKTLRVGILQESFDELTNASAKANAAKTLETLKAIGVKEFIPVKVPEPVGNPSAISVESAVFFDEHARAGRMKDTRSARPTGRLVPAVDYLQSQRMRMMMMMELAKATSHVDVYIAASNNTGVGGPGGPGGRGPGAPGAGPRQPDRPQTPAQRHSNMANLACYPAVNLPNGFADTGTPTNATIFAQPFREMEILALAKAYQDAAKWHLVKPTKMEAL